MGIFFSFFYNTKKIYELEETIEENFIQAGLSIADINLLFLKFQEIDEDRSGLIDMYEFLDFFELTRTKFSEKAFQVVDTDKSGQIDFSEFLSFVYNYCSFTKKALISFSFNLYDTDGSGSIDTSEVRRFIMELWGKEWQRNEMAKKNYEQLVHLAETAASQLISLGDFEEFVRSHPLILFPAFEMQTELQRRVLGVHFWEKIANQHYNQSEKSMWKILRKEKTKRTNLIPRNKKQKHMKGQFQSIQVRQSRQEKEAI